MHISVQVSGVSLVQVSDHTAREFVCKALLQATTDTDAANKTPLAHLLLQTVPHSKTNSAASPVAPHLFSTCCCAQHARLAVKVRIGWPHEHARSQQCTAVSCHLSMTSDVMLTVCNLSSGRRYSRPNFSAHAAGCRRLCNQVGRC